MGIYEMTDTTISDHVTLSEEIQRPDGEITTENLLHNVELYNLYGGRDSAERDTDKIFRITHPTTVLTDIIEKTVWKFTDPEFQNGTHVVSGDFGSGKSHIGLVLHHLFNNPERGQDWLDTHGLDITVPQDVDFHAFQMFNLEEGYDYLWEPIYEYLGVSDQLTDVGDVPTVSQIRGLLEGPTVLFLDELEPWLRMASHQEYKEENLAFLQNLCEAAADGDTPLSVHVTLLYSEDDVTSRVQRTGPHIHDLTVEDEEKIDFILHRLIDTVHETAEEVVGEYVDVYRQNEQIEYEDYQSKEQDLLHSYPFHPDMLQLLMERFSEGSGHQDARGLLDFLTRLLGDSYTAVDLIITSDIDVYSHASRLRAIDHELIPKYKSDYERLALSESDGDYEHAEYVEELLNVVLLHSLTKGGEIGANKRQRIVGVIRKGMGAHAIEQTFQNDVYGQAWHIFQLNGEYSFDTNMNPAARIENRAEDVHRREALGRLERLVHEEFFEGRENVYLWEGTDAVEIPDNTTLKILVRLDASQDYTDDFRAVTSGAEREYNNTLVVVTPKTRASIDSNSGIVQVARRVVAGERLRQEESDLPETFEEVHQQDIRTLRDRTREKFGRVFQPTRRSGDIRLSPTPLDVDENHSLYESTINAIDPDQRRIRREIKDHLEDEEASGVQYQYLRNDFYRLVEFPTITQEQQLKDALTRLCQDGETQIGSAFEESPGTIHDSDTIVHKNFVEIPEDDDDGETTETTLTGGTVGGGDSGGGSGGTSVSTTDPTTTTPTTDTGATDDDGDEEPELVTVPPVSPIAAENRFELEDELERELDNDWVIHEVTLKISGPLEEDDLNLIGFDDHSKLANAVELSQTIELEPEDDTLSKSEVLTYIRDLKTPSHARFRAQFEVESNE